MFTLVVSHVHVEGRGGGDFGTVASLITSAIETVTRDMIQKTWQETEFRLDVSRATNGAHIEMY
jgi:hypothetical protein